jgi:flavin reductase (DIM6/NTAB) family NADH-FMN oxidoreductase RutF
MLLLGLFPLLSIRFRAGRVSSPFRAVVAVHGLEQPQRQQPQPQRPSSRIRKSVIRQTESSPTLDVPVYSLATLNDDGTTNMNIVTYATPVATPPKRVWSLGLFKGTTTDDNIRRRGWCVLQLLTKEHVDIVPILGGTKGRDFDKHAACARVGLPWQSLDVQDDKLKGIQVLPGCVSYIKLDIKGGIVDAGSHHIAAFCEVVGMYECGNDDKDDGSCVDSGEKDSSVVDLTVEHLSTRYLRSLGIITPQGRVAESAIPLTKVQ